MHKRPKLVSKLDAYKKQNGNDFLEYFCNSKKSSLSLSENAINVFPPHYNRIKNSAITATCHTIVLLVRFVKSHDNLVRLNIHTYTWNLAQPVRFRSVSLTVECSNHVLNFACSLPTE